MAASNRILALNIGASQITLAEFKIRSGESPMLLQYGMASLGVEPESDTDPSAFIIDALRTIMKEKGIRPAPLLMTVSGQAVFPRFVKLPPVAKDKLSSMIQYEAEQNVPFPIGEVVWDYQLIGDASDGEQSAMIVAVKTETVVSLTSCVQAVGLEPEIVDVAPLAISNCVQYNYPDLDGCTMILDIGARSTNLLFIEDGRVFYRSIPVAGNTITQEIAKSFEIDFQKAETMKIESGFVALGGVYATEDENADRISKVIRNVVTRLHAEVNRSINFYRSQQGGNPPSRVLLTGGSSIIAHMDTFFREKLKVDVDYLNPFVSVDIGGRVDSAKVGEDFYDLCECVGLAMRKVAPCAAEINLMPPNLIQKKTFRKRLPFFAGAAVALVGGVACLGLHANARANLFAEQSAQVEQKLGSLKTIRRAIGEEVATRDAVLKDLEQYRILIDQRTIAVQRIDAIRNSLLDGMWLTAIRPVADNDGVVTKLVISCRAFDDKMRQAEEEARKTLKVEKTAVELFRDTLIGQKMFTDNVKILKEKDADGLTAKVRECQLEINIAENFQIRKAGN